MSHKDTRNTHTLTSARRPYTSMHVVIFCGASTMWHENFGISSAVTVSTMHNLLAFTFHGTFVVRGI